MNLAVLTDIKKESEKNWRFIFESPIHNELNYISGQLVQLHKVREDGTTLVRNYSLASWADGSNLFELIVTNLEGGEMCNYLFNEAQIGDEIIFRGPMGVFTLPEIIDRPIYFVCTGSGISPFRSMANDVIRNNIPFQKMKLFFGTRTEADLLYLDEMRELESMNPNFEYKASLSRESKQGYHSGYIHDVYLAELEKEEVKPLVYFCGWSGMINEGRQHLIDRGFEMKKDIRVEIFG